ncbi:MAG: ribonuclease III [Gammaproteobacteria bacterium]|nr:ribonuclease III [Gammaproteobacteria bacterium]
MDKQESWSARVLNHQFSDGDLLRQALTHRSKGADNYERLEYLGDSVLGMVIAESLFDRFPLTREGDLTRIRASLVCKESLARIARDLDLGPQILLGPGELKSGGFNRDSILADVFESLIGAIYKDAGIEPARRFIERQFSPILASVNPDELLKDPKTRLQEWLQKRSIAVPHYSVLAVQGEAHHQHFIVHCQVECLPEPVRGEGSSRRYAEQQAAAQAYALLENCDD